MTYAGMKWKCYKCKWGKRTMKVLTGFQCAHPDPKSLEVVPSEIGVQLGEWDFPRAIDPTWLFSCDGYEERDVSP